MKKYTSSSPAFTLVELIVSITISLLLMASIGVFMSSGMQNLFNQQATLKNMHDINDFGNHIRTILNSAESVQNIDSNTLLIRQKQQFDQGGYTVIGTQERTDYCEDTTQTNHLFIHNFIPFEIGGQYVGEYTVGDYISLQNEHKIVNKNDRTNTIIGTGYYGKDFTEGSEGTSAPLNRPTGLALDDEKNLYISDTLNNRILFRPQADIIKNIGGTPTTIFEKEKIYTLLDEKDGLVEPTGLYFDTTAKTLLIANAGKGEVLSFSSTRPTSISTEFTIALTESEATDVARIDVEFWNEEEKVPIDSSSLTIDSSNFSTTENKLETKTDSFSYYLSDFGKNISSSTTTGCTASDNTEEFIFENGTVQKKTITCDTTIDPAQRTESILGAENSDFATLQNSNQLTIKNISFPPTTSGNIFAKVTLFDTSGERIKNTAGTEYLPETENYLTTISDGKIYTKGDNTLSITTLNLAYPNSFDNSGAVLEFDKTKVNFDNTYTLSTPVKDLEIHLSPTPDPDLLFLKLKYYRNFNCYNPDENNSKIKTFLFNANLK